MSVNPLYLSGNYCLVLFHVSLTVKIDTYLPSTRAILDLGQGHPFLFFFFLCCWFIWIITKKHAHMNNLGIVYR
jgi:hypothetical protein